MLAATMRMEDARRIVAAPMGEKMMSEIARCDYCHQPTGAEAITVHVAGAAYHFLCAMLKRREDDYRQRRSATAA